MAADPYYTIGRLKGVLDGLDIFRTVGLTKVHPYSSVEEWFIGTVFDIIEDYEKEE